MHAVRCILSRGRAELLTYMKNYVRWLLNLKLWYGIVEKIYIIHAHCTTR